MELRSPRLGTNALSGCTAVHSLDPEASMTKSVQIASSLASMAAAVGKEEGRSKTEAARSANAASVLLETVTTLLDGGGDEADCQRVSETREGLECGFRSRSGGDGVRLRRCGSWRSSVYCSRLCASELLAICRSRASIVDLVLGPTRATPPMV